MGRNAFLNFLYLSHVSYPARNFVAVHNRFEALSPNDELNVNNMDEIYSNLISVTEAVAKEMLPSKIRGKNTKSKDSPSVKSAPDDLKKLSLS